MLLCLQGLAKNVMILATGRLQAEKAKRSFAMQPRLQAWRGVFAGHEAPHIFARCSPCFAAGKFLPAKKIAKKYTLSLKIQHIVCNYKTKKTRRKKQ